MENMFQKLGHSQNIIFLLGIIVYTICLFTITDIALMFFATYVIASALNPLVDKLEKKCFWEESKCIIFCGTYCIVFEMVDGHVWDCVIYVKFIEGFYFDFLNLGGLGCINWNVIIVIVSIIIVILVVIIFVVF